MPKIGGRGPGFWTTKQIWASGCEKIIFIGKQHLVSFFCWVSFCEVHDAIWKAWHGFIGEIHKDFIKDNLSLVEKQFMNGKKSRSVLKVAPSPKMQLVMSIQIFSFLASGIGILLR